jgi:hypothetical protein
VRVAQVPALWVEGRLRAVVAALPFCSDSGSGTHRPWSTVFASGRVSTRSARPSRRIRVVSNQPTNGRPPLEATCSMPLPSKFDAKRR